MTGEADGEPQKVGAPAADMLAGQDAAFGALAALFRRQDAAPVSLGDAGSTLIKIIVVMMLVLAGMWLLAAMFGASSSGSGSGWGRSSGGSFGGYSSGGGHK